MANLVSYRQYIDQIDAHNQGGSKQERSKKPAAAEGALKDESSPDTESLTAETSTAEPSNSARKPTGVTRKPLTLIAKKTAKELSVAEELAAMATRLTPEQAKIASELTEVVREFCRNKVPYESSLQIQGELCVVYDDNATTAIFSDNFTKPEHTDINDNGRCSKGSLMR